MYLSVTQKSRALLVAAFAMVFASLGVLTPQSSQAALTLFVNDTDPALAFVKTNSTNLVGSGGTAVNDVVLYKTVGTYGGVGVDAVVTTLSVSGSITNYDNPGSASTAAGYLNNWMINTVGGEARFRFQFFKAGTYTGANTGIPVVLQNVKITSIDLDCSSAAGSYQYTDATGFQKYSMMSPTNLAVKSMTGPNRVRFIANKTGSRSSVPEDQVMLKYDAVQTIEFSFGNVVAGSTNYFGLMFGGWPNGGVPVEYTNVFNTPPTSNNTTKNVSGATILSINDFGTYGDVDNNPFFSVVINSVSDGTLEWWNGSAWVSVTAGQAILVGDIEKGYLKFTPGTGNSNISFNVNDGLDNSTAPYTLAITKVTTAQTITFNNPGMKGAGSGSFPSGATATSGLTVTLVSLTPGICTVSGLDIVPVSAGTCVIVASQPGDATVGAAPDVKQEFKIVAGSAPSDTQTITFNQPADQSLETATVNSGAISNVTNGTTLTPTLTSNTPSTCSVTGLTINILAAGVCTITASQPGTSTIAPATDVTRSFNITAVAGGGTVPIAQTWGAAIPTGGSTLKLTGFVDYNSASTTYYFCYTENAPASSSTKILTAGSSKQLYCTSNQTSSTVGQVLTADITYGSNNTSGSAIKSGNTVYFQIVAYHNSNAKVYGVIMQLPTSGYVTTSDATSVQEKTATLNGTAKNTSSKSSRNLYFCVNAVYNVYKYVQLANTDGKCDKIYTSNPATLDKSSSTSSATAGATGLVANTYYYYQLYMSSSSKSYYGNIVRFKTASAAPEATTLGVTGYTSNGVTLTGSILSNDNAVTPKFCYSETPTATSGVLTESNCVSGALKTANPTSITSGTRSITLPVTGLVSGKTYYYQAAGVYNTTTKFYGAIKSFTFGAPSAVTLSATDVKVNSGVLWESTLNGFINVNGGTSTNYFCLAETNTVTAKGAMTSCVTGGGAIALETATVESTTSTASILLTKTGLTAGTTYYFQAIGRNLTTSPSLDNFGEVLKFVTAYAPDVTTEDVLVFGIDTATVRGTLTANGALTTGSFCISTSNATTIIDGILDSCLFVVGSSPSTTTGSAIAITGDVTGLSQATTYYYQAIGDNSQGTNYGVIKSFTTLAGVPVATTVAATNVMGTTATLNGRINPGGAATTVKFCYGTSSSLSGCTLSDTVTVLNGSAGLTGVSLNISGLNANTQYYFRVQGVNSQGTTQGSILSFITGSPTSKTLAASAVTGTGAVLNGTVKANGSNITSVKFCLTTSSTVGASGDLTCSTSNPNASPSSFNSSITIDNPESATVTGLTSGTIYYFQIVGTNAQGTTYGDVLSFTAGAPIGITKPATSVTGSTARINATVNRVNDSSATASFCLSDAEDVNPDGTLVNCIQTLDIPSSQFATLTSDDPVYADLTDLVAGNMYFFQILTTGTNGASIGEVLNFSTGYSVQFLANGGSGSMSDQASTVAAALTTNGYSRSGYTFAGWSTTAGGSVAYTDGASYGFTSNLVLYAIWNQNAAPTPAPTVKQKPKLTWNNPSPIKQGTPLSGTQLNGITDVPSVCVYTPALGTVLPAGTYTLSVTCTPNDPNYEPITGTVTLIVKGKVKPQILWFNPSPIINPTPLSPTQLNALANLPGKYTYNPPAGTILAPGKHPLNVHFVPDNKDDNEEMDANVTIEVLEKDTKPAPAPSKPVTQPDTKTATSPAPAVILATAGKVETITVRPNEDKTGIIVQSQDWSLAIKSTTQFVQGNTTDTSARVVIEKGNTVTTSGTGFKPFSQVDVWVYSTPTWLGAVMTDQFGNFTTTLPMPPSLPEGDHTFQAQGQTPDSKERTAAIPITLVPATVTDKPGSLKFEVYFGMNSPVVTKAESARIAKLVKFAMAKMATGAKVTIDIAGWVQPNPNPGDIKYLSTNRAKNVKKALIALGLKGSYTLKFPGLAKDNIPTARHASVVIKWSKSK